MISAETSTALFVKMVLLQWQTQNTRVNDWLDKVSDEQMLQETAPGRNTGVYLFGHLVAANDDLFRLLGIGEKLHPELNDIFIKSPDKSGKVFPPVATLKQYWKEINDLLTAKFETMQPGEWFERHTVVSAEDFVKEPHRNKLNIIITRAVHQAYHLGQMNYLV